MASTTSDLVRTAREQLTGRYVLSVIAFLAIVYGFTREIETVIVITLGFTLVTAIEVLRDAPSIDDRWVGIGIGSFVITGSLAWFGYELTAAADTGGPAWFPALTALIGVWLLLDARRDFVKQPTTDPTDGMIANDPTDEMSVSELMLVMNHASLVAKELKQGPKTVKELADTCDLTESRIREALRVGVSNNTIYRVDNDRHNDVEQYALDESEVGTVAFVRSNGKRVIRRLARPFRY